MNPIRIQRSRQHKQISPNELPIKYVGRPTKFGNPFRVEEMEFDGQYSIKTSNPCCTEILTDNCHVVYKTKMGAIEDAINCYEIYIKGTDLSALKGYNLSCWCRIGDPCHVDVLLKILNQTL